MLNDVVAVGVGHKLRGDDGAGIIALERLQEVVADVDGVVAHGDLTNCLSEIQKYRHVIVFDAVVTGAKELGEVMVWDLSEKDLGDEAISFSTHGMSIGKTLELARQLQQLPPKVTLIGIESSGFEVGCPISREVSQGIHRAVDVARKIIEEDRYA